MIINTRGSWLPGDARGFRSRGHRIHSSGDYTNPPPKDEHQGLRRHQQRNSTSAVVIPENLYAMVGEALLKKVTSQKYRLLAISVGPVHAHLLVELPDHRATVKRFVGTWKQASSHAVCQYLPGRIWCRDCDPVPIRDRDHHKQAYGYILKHAQKEGAWVWSYRDGGL